MSLKSRIENLITKPRSIAPLVIFRILFGLLMLFSLVRFLYNGWVEEFYVLPVFNFTYYGFDWLQPLPQEGMYLVFAFMIVACILIILGWYYRWAIGTFFILFSYVELLDKTYYLNHYYFISLVSFILIWLPASSRFSLDIKFGRVKEITQIPAWTIYILMFQIGVVYFFAGIAKINSDWLLEAQPLKIWLQAHTWWPVVGFLFGKEWVAYAFSWFGMIYDVTIVFFLLYSSTRIWAYLAVVFFHVITGIMFPIGVFPYVMISLTLLFFSESFHERILTFLERKSTPVSNHSLWFPDNFYAPLLKGFFIFYILIQIALPFRYLAYEGPLFWREEGYRFSWRVMLMEKTGMCTFFIHEDINTPPVVIDSKKYLTPLQEHMMATQPDMILQFAHYLETIYRNKGMSDPKVFADCIVSLQGKRSKPFIDSTVDLSEQKRGFSPHTFILPYE